MAIYPEPSVVLVPTLIAGLALAVRGGWQRRSPAARPGLRVAVAAVLGALALAVGAGVCFDTGDRRVPVWAGLALGALLGLVWEWALPPKDTDPAELGPLGAGLAALALLGLTLPVGVPFANAALGLLAGWGVPLVTRLAAPAPADVTQPASPGLALSAVGLAAGAAAWGARLSVHGAQGEQGQWPLALGLLAFVAVGLAAAELTGSRRSGVVGALVAGVVFLLGGLALAGGPFQQPQPMLVGLAVGAGAGVLGALFIRDSAAGAPAEGNRAPIWSLLFLLVAGVVLVVENRLLGILAIGLGGLGLLSGARGANSPRALMAVTIAIFAARVWLQLFLDRTNLTGYGVDLTHPYAFAALVVGGLLPAAVLALGRPLERSAATAVLFAVALALLPGWLGYMVHVEALGGLLAGLLLAAFMQGARGAGEELALVPPLLLQSLAVTMLASPWLVDQMNAARAPRMIALAACLAVVAVGLVGWWLGARRPQPAA